MAANFQRLSTTNSVRQAQKHYYGDSDPAGDATAPDALTPEEVEFIGARDSFYMATINSEGWPYIQHRGGRPGFLRVLDSHQLAFADYRGNRQMLSTGNLADNDRVALFLMDYPQRTRLKILGHARVEDARQNPELVQRLAEPEAHRLVERLFFIKVVAFDWNCPKYITPRYTAEDIQKLVAPLKQRIAELEGKKKNGS
ncbi:MAG TPA: pyridoxamine 5'-phosphate oxidase family protein [Candidatus Dormibacteraeota bacterium]|nr:pyridoxamine 5'-phosphate oxidase family protein [Candidatus Dormibacteraeota bacterium]